MPKKLRGGSAASLVSAASAERPLEEGQHAPKAAVPPRKASTGTSSVRTTTEDLQHMKDEMASLGEKLDGKLERLVHIAGDAERARLKDVELVGQTLERLRIMLDEAPEKITERIGAALGQVEERKTRDYSEPQLHPPNAVTTKLLQTTHWDSSRDSQQAGVRAIVGVDVRGLPDVGRLAGEADGDPQQAPSVLGVVRLSTERGPSGPLGRSVAKAVMVFRQAGQDLGGWQTPTLSHEAKPQRSERELLLDRLDYMSMSLILTNTIFLGAEAQIRLDATIVGEDCPGWVFWVSLAFTFSFLVELCAKIYILRADFFRVNRAWHAFDTFLVMMSLGGMILEILNLTFLRAMRISRALRAVRIMRAIGYVQDLRLMVASIMSSLPSLCWACVLLVLLLYLCSLLIMQGVEMYTLKNPRDDAMIDLFGHVGTTMASLFMSISGGIDWRDCVEPLAKVHPLYFPFFMAFVGFLSFGVLGVLTRVMIEASAGIMDFDHDLVIQKNIKQEAHAISHLKKLFQEAAPERGEDNPNSITQEQMDKVLGRRNINALLQIFQLNVSQTRGVFHLLDGDDSGKVDAEEFVTGLLRLRGNAKEVGVATILCENKRLSDQMEVLLKLLSDRIPELHSHADARRQPMVPSYT